MAGKVTYKHGKHPARGGWGSGTVIIEEETLRYLSGALGRAINDAEKEEIKGGIETYRTMRNVAIEAPKNQDVIRSLGALSKLHGGDAEKAYRDCDPMTACLLKREFYHHPELNNPCDIHKAAEMALKSFSGDLKYTGANTKGYQVLFVQWCLEAWERMGGVGDKVWQYGAGEDLSPLLSWVTGLLTLLESRQFDSKKAKDLASLILKR